ncbi:unnamed protein product [marine sediment metagenome]|uniref:Uncharacterized protein n=1 Tax=marine sediment metagenome TaxID=412755 RepID=X0ZLW3_9ZZZZ
MKPGFLGNEIRTAYPPEMAVEMACAVIEYNKPGVMNFLEHEGIPLMAAIGGGEVADDARLAKAAKGLGGGAGGLQGIQKVVGMLGSSKKGGGLGDIMALANTPLGQKFLERFTDGQSSGPSNGGPPSQSASMGYHTGGKLGGN